MPTRHCVCSEHHADHVSTFSGQRYSSDSGALPSTSPMLAKAAVIAFA
jgi:hypothetical protein